MRKVVLALALLIATDVAAAPAVKIPPLKLCVNNTTGAIVAKKACKFGETTLTGQALQALGSAGPQGPKGDTGAQGPTGAPGAKGGFDWTKCTVRLNAASDFGFVANDFNCGPGEFLMTHGALNTTPAIVDSMVLDFDSTNRVAIGVSYLTTTIAPGAFNTVTVSGVCCLP